MCKIENAAGGAKLHHPPGIGLTLFALGGAQCALTAVIALKTQKNEKKFLKKVQICPTHHPPRSSPSPPFYSMYRDA